MPGLGVVILDGMLTIRFADGPLFDGTGMREAVGKTLAETLPRRELEEYLQLCRRALQGELCVLEREATKDRGTHLTEFVPLRNHEGEVTGVMAVTHDLSLQMRATRAQQAAERAIEAERRAADDRFELAFGHAPTGVAIAEAGLDGRFTAVNHTLAEMLGYSEAELGELSELDLVHTDDVGEITSAIAALEGGRLERWSKDVRVINSSGDELWVSASIAPLRDEDGIVLNRVVHMLDISDQLRARIEREQAAAEARDQAVEASAMKSRFVAGISHELRTPLSGVLGMLELLEQSGPLSDAQSDLLSKARGAADVLLRVINDVLDLSKAEHGRMQLGSAPVHVDRLLDELRATFSFPCTEKGITFLTGREASVPRVVVGDPTRLRQVLLNLAGNAVKFTDSGNVTIRVLREPSSPTLLRFEVEDTGIGIADEDLDHLFEPFHQVDASITRRHDGTGLGLAISRELVQLMGGQVGVSSVEGRGSTFWFTAALPEYEPEERLRLPRDLPVSPEATPQINGRGKSVLVVEDNEVNQQLAVLRLKRHGFDVDVAENGREAVELAQDGDYDLILMDCYMPVLDGFSATGKIREAEGDGSHTPILAMTAGALDADRQRCVDVGMDDFLVKPVRQLDLDQALQRWIS